MFQNQQFPLSYDLGSTFLVWFSRASLTVRITVKNGDPPGLKVEKDGRFDFPPIKRLDTLAKIAQNQWLHMLR